MRWMASTPRAVTAGLVAGGEDGADIDVAGPGLLGRQGLFQGMAGGADDEVRGDPMGRGHGEVLLAQVDPVGARGQGDVHPVIDNQQSPRCPSSPAEFHRQLIKTAVFQVLFPELDDSHPGGQDLVQNL